MKQIAKNLKGNTFQLVLGPLFKLLEAILELCVPLVVANMIDVGVSTGDTAALLHSGAILLALAVGGAVCAFICQYFAAVAAGNFGLRLRAQAYAHAMQLAAGQVAQFGAGGLITRLTNDVNHIQTGVNMFIRLGTRVPFLLFGALFMALRLNWRMGLVFLAAMPVIGLVLFWVMRRTLPSYAKIQAKQDELARLSGENLAGARVIRAFSRQADEQREFDASADDLTALTVRVGRLSALLNPATGFIASLAIVGLVWLGGNLAFKGLAAPGEVIAMVSYMNQILLAMVVAANLIVLFTRAVASTKRVAALLDTTPSITDGPGATPMDDTPVVAFEDVRFGYYKDAEPVLENISLSLRAGQTVGVIGGTGSGKSTLASLMARFYDVDSGAVYVRGQDVRRYTLQSLRGQFGWVPQTAVLLSGSVRHNLQMGQAGANDETLWQALRTAQAEDFVRGMQGGLDAEIQEGGKNLSGGQRQRLTIARALVRQPKVLVLDDASSALDYATDARLRQALAVETQERGMTVMIISQRAASLRHADVIWVLDDGRLAGSGTHTQLLAQNPVYQEICTSQGITE